MFKLNKVLKSKRRVNENPCSLKVLHLQGKGEIMS